MKTTRIERLVSFVLFGALLLGGCEPGARDSEEAVFVAPVIEASTRVENALSPSTAIDGKTGVAYLAFFRKDNEETNVFLSSRAPGDAAWGEPVRVNSIPGDASVHAQAPAQVVVGPAGQVYVVWTNSIPIEGRRFPASNLFFARSVDGGRSFAEQTAVNSDAAARSSSHTFHDIAVGPEGEIYVSWLDSRRRDAATATAAATPVQPISHSAHNHAPTADLPGTELWVAVSSDEGRTFSAGSVAAENTCQCCRTSLAVAANGTVYLAWRHLFDGTERDMAIIRSTDGGETFSAPERIHADSWAVEACPHSGPSLAFDAAGRLHAAWYTGEASRAGLYYAWSDDGRTFSDPQPLVTGVGVSQVKLSGNGQPSVLIAWEDKTTQLVRLGYTVDGGIQPLEGAFDAGMLPAVATGANGWIAVAQQESDAMIVSGR